MKQSPFCSRIYELLPPKIQQWQSSPCVAEEKNKRTLEKIRRQQMEARQKLGELEQRHQELDTIVEKAKNARIDPEEEVGAIIYMYCNFPEFSDIFKISFNQSKNQTKRFYHRVMPPSDAEENANSEEPDQTAPLGAV